MDEGVAGSLIQQQAPPQQAQQVCVVDQHWPLPILTGTRCLAARGLDPSPAHACQLQLHPRLQRQRDREKHGHYRLRDILNVADVAKIVREACTHDDMNACLTSIPHDLVQISNHSGQLEHLVRQASAPA